MNLLELIFTVVSAYITFKLMKSGEHDAYHLPDEEMKEEEVKNVILCNTQTISGHIYVWNKNTNEFITQGKDMNDIVEFFKKKHPNTKVILTERVNEETGIQTNG